jgi:hypothetical protein
MRVLRLLQNSNNELDITRQHTANLTSAEESTGPLTLHTGACVNNGGLPA